EIRLIVVVLPDPLGPMRPRISPGRMARGRASTATSPPNRLVRPCVSSNHPFSDTVAPFSTPSALVRISRLTPGKFVQAEHTPLWGRCWGDRSCRGGARAEQGHVKFPSPLGAAKKQ